MEGFLNKNGLSVAIIALIIYMIMFPRQVQLDVSNVVLNEVSASGTHYIISAKVSTNEGLLPDGRMRIIINALDREIEMMSVDENGNEAPAPFEGIAAIAAKQDVVAHFIDPLLLQAEAGDVVELNCQSGDLEFFNCQMIEPIFR